MHILIIEAALTGHHAGYLERITSAFLEAGHTVSVTVLESETEHQIIQRIRDQFRSGFRIEALDIAAYQLAIQSSFGEPGRELALRELFGSVYRMINKIEVVDYVFLPYLDYCLYAIGLLGSPFGSTRWGGICMRPSFHYQHCGVIAPLPRLARLKEYLFLRVLRGRTLNRIYTIDELLQRFVCTRYPLLKARLQHVADPAELKGNHTRATAREKLGIGSDDKVVLVYGAINERKGLDVLITALTDTALDRKLTVLIVGKQSPAVRSLLKSDPAISLLDAGRSRIIDAFVEGAVEQMAFAAADVIWLGYRGHYTMSGVLALAIKFEKLVIATKIGLIGWYASRYERAITVDVDKKHEVVRALTSICDENFGKNKEKLKIGRMDWENLLEKISVL